ncbi:MAG: GtrA family protein [Actinobacteria bacterium]|jgi:GtrA-like protein.|nr:GtrA family protein [Actinomycetota bacterium]
MGAAARFVMAGLVNTLLTGALLSVLASFMNPSIAYTLTFLAGIGLSLFLAGRFVFRAPITRGRAVSYVLLYLGVYVVGLLVLRAALDAGLPRSFSGLVVVVTAALGFLGGRIIFSDRRVTHD